MLFSRYLYIVIGIVSTLIYMNYEAMAWGYVVLLCILLFLLVKKVFKTEKTEYENKLVPNFVVRKKTNKS